MVDISQFCGSISEDISSFFTQAQKQKLIYKEIENIRAAECDSHIPGYSNVKLYPGKSISEPSVLVLSIMSILCFTHSHSQSVLHGSMDWQYKHLLVCICVCLLFTPVNSPSLLSILMVCLQILSTSLVISVYHAAMPSGQHKQQCDTWITPY